MVDGVSGVPKTPHSLNNSLEGFSELRISVILIVMFIMVKRYRLKSGKGKDEQRRVQEKPGTDFLLSSLRGMTQIALNSPRNNV